MFTFLPAFAEGTGISVQAMSRVIGARDMSGLAAPIVASRVKSWGTWSTMTWAGLTSSIGLAMMLMGPPGVVIGLIVWGISRTAYLVSVSTWVADAVAYERRGRASGLLELTWAGAALGGLPLIGLLIDQVGWWAAPSALSLLGAPIALWSWRLGSRLNTQQVTTGPIASSYPDESANASSHTDGGRRSWMVDRSTMLAISGFALQAGSAQFIFFTHGLWLKDTYGFNPMKAGAAIMMIGLAEALSSSATSLFTDRLGKRNSVVLGSAVMAASFAALALFPAPRLLVGLGLLALAFLGFEFSIVSSMPLITELEPENRSATIGASTASGTATRALVTVVAGPLYVMTSFGFTMAIACAAAITGMSMTWFLVAEPS